MSDGPEGASPEAETVFRTQLLGELLADLQVLSGFPALVQFCACLAKACRLMAKKFCCTDLRLELSDKVGSSGLDDAGLGLMAGHQ